MHYWFGGAHMIWVLISWIVGIGLFVALFSIVFLALKERSQTADSPETILRRRYAAGEIDTEEYERRLGELRKTTNAA